MIYTRIDTYSVILYNCSVRNILENLAVPTENLDIAFKNAYEKHDVKVGDTFVWSFKGIRLESKLTEYKDKETAESIFDIDFSWIRLYISGEGIDYIYSLTQDIEGYDFSVALCNPDFWLPVSEIHKITRCDFAFDFVNYEGDDFERLRKIIASADFDEKLSKAGRLYTTNNAGLTYSYRGGKERTIYLGSTGADRMLRIYDKKFQVQDEFGNISTEKIPQKILDNEITVDTWYRVELQTRENFAERYLVSCGGNFRYIMGEISAYFDVRKADGRRISSLHKIFLWSERTPIIQNAKSSCGQKEIICINSWVYEIASTSILTQFAVYDWEEWCIHFNESIKSRIEHMTPKQKTLYFNRLNNQISLVAQQEGLTFDNFGNIGCLIKGDDGGFYLSPPPRSDTPPGPYVKGGSV